MTGTASVLLHPDVVNHLVQARADEIEVIDQAEFGDGLVQIKLAHHRLPHGYNGQTEMFFIPWPHGEIHFRREADT